MKKLFTLAITFALVLATQAQTADEVISKYLNAAGGRAKLESIKSLQYVQTIDITTPMGPIQITMTQIRVKNKLVRFNTSSELFGNAFSVVTDTSGWLKMPASQFTGSEEILQKLKPEEISSFKSLMNSEGFFPDLVNYAEQGYTAELAGENKVNGKLSYKVKLKKDKLETIYFIDKQTGFVNSVIYKGAAAAALTGMGNGMNGGGGKLDKLEITCNFSEYKDISGVKFPGKMVIETPMGTINSTIGFVTVNPTIDAKWYRAE